MARPPRERAGGHDANSSGMRQPSPERGIRVGASDLVKRASSLSATELYLGQDLSPTGDSLQQNSAAGRDRGPWRRLLSCSLAEHRELAVRTDRDRAGPRRQTSQLIS